MQASFQKIATHIREGQSLSEAATLYLFESNNLIDIGFLASQWSAKSGRHEVAIGDHRFVRTMFEEFQPSFFASLPSDAASLPTHCAPLEKYLERLCARIDAVIAPTTSELRLCPVNPNVISMAVLVAIITRIRARFPSLNLRALSAHEIVRYAHKEQLDDRVVIEALAKAGLKHLGGRGGSPAFPFIRPSIPIDSALWLTIHERAHRAGIKSDATMAYGHGETYFDRLQFLKDLRQLQDRTGGFLSFSALPRQSASERLSPTLGIDDLKMVAISRLYLHNFEVISAPWGRLGLDVAQLALTFGASALDGTLSDDSNDRMPGARPFRSLSCKKLQTIIRKAENIPIILGDTQSALREVAMQLPRLNRDESRIQQLLYQTEQGKQLSVEEAITLTRDASLLELGYCAAQIKSQLVNTQKVGVLTRAYELPVELLLTTQAAFMHTEEVLEERFKVGCDDEFSIHINFGKWSETLDTLRIKHIDEYFRLVKERYPRIQCVVKGLKGIWRLVQLEQRPLIRVLQHIKDTGIMTIESSGNEAEDDFTIREILTTHRTIHELDITSVAKVELAAPPSGFAPPFWEAFIKRLDSLRELQEQTHGILGLKVEPARNAVISPVEYLKAIAISRIIARNIPNIVAPFLKIPSLEEKNAKPVPTTFKSCLKFMPVCIHFGANDVGFIKYASEDVGRIYHELKDSGLAYYQRNMRFYPIEPKPSTR